MLSANHHSHHSIQVLFIDYFPLISPKTDKMTMLEIIGNTLQMILPAYFSKMRFEEELKMIEPYYNGTKTWRKHLEGVAFNMVNSNRYLDYASPTLPKTVFIGGMQVNTNKNGKVKLYEDWDDLLNQRKQNVLVSFGSNAFSSDMPDEFKKTFLEVFASTPDVTFIWKYEEANATLASHLKNVKLTTWMPQNDLLADPRLTLFVTHGGLGSSIELAHQGKPAIVIPLMADQPRNAHMLTRHGGALQLGKSDLNDPEIIRNAIRDVLENKVYQENAERLAKILKYQPYSPADVVLKHCDFAVKFGPLDTLQSEGRHLNLFQFYSYDIFVVLFLIVLSIIVIIVLIFTVCLRFFRKFSSNKVKKE
ncbi:Protein CBG24768 [Caenorhabditis briggsae]|uniref:UDP-glucuronosyltransferase n=1 Tax=Caenorhabditis briggsae TaxID=6238 RepID=A8WLF7_CAEBR|nr:Protein CBG24768 [Caenorhabditis briggsae]CAP21302.2 Protein CBG24768 [Caenorhabditis briggsae]